MSERDDAIKLARAHIDSPPPTGKLAKFYIDHLLDYENAQVNLAEAVREIERAKSNAAAYAKSEGEVKAILTAVEKAAREAAVTRGGVLCWCGGRSYGIHIPECEALRAILTAVILKEKL